MKIPKLFGDNIYAYQKTSAFVATLCFVELFLIIVIACFLIWKINTKTTETKIVTFSANAEISVIEDVGQPKYSKNEVQNWVSSNIEQLLSYDGKTWREDLEKKLNKKMYPHSSGDFKGFLYSTSWFKAVVNNKISSSAVLDDNGIKLLSHGKSSCNKNFTERVSPCSSLYYWKFLVNVTRTTYLKNNEETSESYIVIVTRGLSSLYKDKTLGMSGLAVWQIEPINK